jgi:hypothetical protein
MIDALPSTGSILSQDEQTMLERVPSDGTTIGNKSLREALGWDDQRYFSVKNKLVADRLLARGRGKGGAVRKIVINAIPVNHASGSTSDLNPPTVNHVAGRIKELDLYDPMKKVIESEWALDNNWTGGDFVVEVTGKQGSKQTGGKWSRPDITLLGVRRFSYLPTKYFEVITFEIKPCDDFDVTVVYEALGHRRAATRSYALIHLPTYDTNELTDFDKKALDDICYEAKTQGVGVIVAQDPSDYDTWEELVEATRCEPDPEKLEQFLGFQLGSKRDWLRTHY